MKLLVIEDEHKIANSIQKGLTHEGYIVDISYDGQEGYDLASEGGYDVIILDIMLPLMDGVTLCKKLREEHIHTPVLMLTARGEIENRVEGLNSGADDYLVKPFAFAELLARIKALTRRPKSTFVQTITVEDLSLDPQTYDVKRGDRLITLSRKEFSLLEYLMRHPGQTVTKDQIIENVWNYDADILPNTVEVYIGYLRTKIDKIAPDRKPLIQTIRGFGYKIGGS